MSTFGIDLDTLKHLEQQAIAAEGTTGVVEFRKVPELGDNCVAQVHRNGTVELLTRESRRYHYLGNLRAVQEWLHYVRTMAGHPIVVWVDSNRIEIVLNDMSEVRPHNGACCDVLYSAEFELIKEFARNPKYYDQKSFVRLLRSEIGHCLVDPLGLVKSDPLAATDIRKEIVDTFSVLKFESRNRTAGGITQTSDFLGREHQDEVFSGTLDRPREVPQAITLYLRPYQDSLLTLRYPLTCEVLINYEKCTLALAPSQTDLDNLIETARDSIRELLQSNLPENVRLFVGRP